MQTEQISKIKLDSIKIEMPYDDDADLSFIGEFSDTWKEGAIEHSKIGSEYKYFHPANPEYGNQEYKRMLEFCNGSVESIGIVAKAKISVPMYGNTFITQTIESGGLWGIESDSGDAYLREIVEEELNGLKEILKVLNVDIEGFDTMAKEAVEESYDAN